MTNNIKKIYLYILSKNISGVKVPAVGTPIYFKIPKEYDFKVKLLKDVIGRDHIKVINGERTIDNFTLWPSDLWHKFNEP